jgi:tRNA(fMet)-specific endonuclease VapC
MGVILDSSILIAFERRRFDLERFLADHSAPALAAITAAELLIGVERADTAEGRARRDLCSKHPVASADSPV